MKLIYTEHLLKSANQNHSFAFIPFSRWVMEFKLYKNEENFEYFWAIQ